MLVLSSVIHIKKNEKKFFGHGDMHDHLTRGRGDLVAIQCRITKSQKRPESKAIKLYNQLPRSTTQISLLKFKKVIKKHLMVSAIYGFEEYLNISIPSK